MQRADFLKVLGLGAAGIILPGIQNLGSKKIKIYDNYLKGIAHYDYKNVMEFIKEGDEVSLKRDFDNHHDSFAIEVHFEKRKLGYIAAYENIVLANLLEQGVGLKAFVSKKHKSGSQYNDVAIEVYAEVLIQQNEIIQTTNLEKRADDCDDFYRNQY